MVTAVQEGSSLRAVARRFHVSLATVQRWMIRAQRAPLDQVDWSSRPPIAHSIHRTPASIEQQVIALRRALQTSVLGECGALAIHQTLERQRVRPVPSVRTIGRILERTGILDAKRRLRRPPPPPGWYLPSVASRRADVDCFDVVEDHALEGGLLIQVLTCLSLHGALPGAWPVEAMTADAVLQALQSHWQAHGRPAYAQFDNAPLFTGMPKFTDVFSRVVRYCWCLNITPVFVPIREMGFQAGLERFNGRWQAKVWGREFYSSRSQLCRASARYITAYARRTAVRQEAAPPRRPYPQDVTVNLKTPPPGKVILLRRCNDRGAVAVLGRQYTVSERWSQRLIRCEVDLPLHCIRFYGLRRRAPQEQPLLLQIPYHAIIRPLQRVTS